MLMCEIEFRQVWHKWAQRVANKAAGHNDAIAQASLWRIYILANSSIEEIKENLISHIEIVLACGVCVPKRDPREIHREQRDSDAPIPASFFTLGESKRSLPSGPRNFESLLEVFLLRGNTRFSGKTSEWHAITCTPNDPHRFDAKANKVSGNRQIRVISHLSSHKSAHTNVKENRNDWRISFNVPSVKPGDLKHCQINFLLNSYNFLSTFNFNEHQF